MINLLTASESLDASAKIYGLRVDKVHSDLLKVVGVQDKKDYQDEGSNVQDGEEPDANKKKGQQKKKKKQNHRHILCTTEALKGSFETYDPLSLIRCQIDTQTSDMLFQAGLPQHANQGVALNLYNDIVLDKVFGNGIDKSSKLSVGNIEDYTILDVCPSYAAFKFMNWSPHDEQEEHKSQVDEIDGKYHFDLDATLPDDNFLENNVMMDCGDKYEERCDRLAQNNQRFEDMVDFQDIIANNPNPNATYEYSYLQKNCKIHWAGPMHWKIILNKNLQGSRVVEEKKATKRKKEIELVYTYESKEEGKIMFNQTKRPIKIPETSVMWSEDKVIFPEYVHDLKRLHIFYNKPSEHFTCANYTGMKELPAHNVEDNFDYNVQHDLSKCAEPDGEHFGSNSEDERFTQSQGAFLGNNLVSVPKLTNKVFIPYSQRAKKVRMRYLKKAMWDYLKKSSKETEEENVCVQGQSNEDIEPTVFSDMYTELPKMLPKVDADSWSPAIALVSLLHLANERNLILERDPVLSNLIIRSGKNEN